MRIPVSRQSLAFYLPLVRSSLEKVAKNGRSTQQDACSQRFAFVVERCKLVNALMLTRSRCRCELFSCATHCVWRSVLRLDLNAGCCCAPLRQFLSYLRGARGEIIEYAGLARLTSGSFSLQVSLTHSEVARPDFPPSLSRSEQVRGVHTGQRYSEAAEPSCASITMSDSTRVSESATFAPPGSERDDSICASSDYTIPRATSPTTSMAAAPSSVSIEPRVPSSDKVLHNGHSETSGQKIEWSF